MKSGLEYLSSPSKRRLDLIGGVAISSLLLPAGTITALLSEVDTKSLNPIFKQTRVGMKGHPLNVHKFRTLPKRIEQEEAQILGTFDPRASKLGLAIREIDADEMPQLINVLRGEMSLVGMRPLLSQDLDRL